MCNYHFSAGGHLACTQGVDSACGVFDSCKRSAEHRAQNRLCCRLVFLPVCPASEVKEAALHAPMLGMHEHIRQHRLNNAHKQYIATETIYIKLYATSRRHVHYLGLSLTQRLLPQQPNLGNSKMLPVQRQQQHHQESFHISGTQQTPTK